MNEDLLLHALPSLNRLSHCRVLVVGDLILDRYWYGDVQRISPEAPVPVVNIYNQENRLGGAANVALNIKNLGGQVTLLSVIGCDNDGDILRQLLHSSGIDTELCLDDSMETIVKLRVISRRQQMMRIDFEKEPDHEVLANMMGHFEESLANHDAVLFSDYGKGGLAHISRMIELARAAEKPILIDPKGDAWSRYNGATVITPNCAELTKVIGSWTSEAQLYDKVQTLLQELRLNALLLTRSEHGMTLFEEGNVNSVSAQALEVADVTGAGDTVIATMALMVACNMGLVQAMSLANRAGGLVVAKFGTASITYNELNG